MVMFMPAIHANGLLRNQVRWDYESYLLLQSNNYESLVFTFNSYVFVNPNLVVTELLVISLSARNGFIMDTKLMM